MSGFEAPEKQAPRIRWAGDGDDDIESNSRPRGLYRSTSNASINSSASRRGSIDPAHALPIQYRTVSIHIEESRDKVAQDAVKVKDATAKGLLDPMSPATELS